MTRSLVLPSVAAVLALAASARPAAAGPDQLSFTARVVDAGVPLTGSHTVSVRLHHAATGGTAAWTEVQQVTAVEGLVYVTLGNQTPLTTTIVDGGPLFAEVQIDSTVLSPRLALTSAAYAIRAEVADDAELLGGQAPSAFATAAHTHAGVYLPVGATLACNGTDKVVGINGATGSVVCSPDAGGTTYTAGLGLTLSGTQFGVTFGGSGAQATVARSDHNHAGTYLPVGPTLACTGTDKVTGLTAAGSVTCSPDAGGTTYSAGTGLSLTGSQFSVLFAGSGIGASAAHSDHNHAGVYLPVGSALACPAGEFQVGMDTAGNVTCAAETGDITGIVTGTGLTGTTTSGTATLSVVFAGNGTANAAARSDHTHAPALETCPTGYTAHIASGTLAVLCVKRVAAASVWTAAATACFVSHNGGALCTHNEMRIAVSTFPTETLITGYWLADRVDDNWVLRVGSTNPLDFDEKIEIVNTPVTSPGYYCCRRGE